MVTGGGAQALLLGLQLLLQAGSAHSEVAAAPSSCLVAHQIHVSTSPASVTSSSQAIFFRVWITSPSVRGVCVLALRGFQTLMGQLLASGLWGRLGGWELV